MPKAGRRGQQTQRCHCHRHRPGMMDHHQYLGGQQSNTINRGFHNRAVSDVLGDKPDAEIVAVLHVRALKFMVPATISFGHWANHFGPTQLSPPSPDTWTNMVSSFGEAPTTLLNQREYQIRRHGCVQIGRSQDSLTIVNITVAVACTGVVGQEADAQTVASLVGSPRPQSIGTPRPHCPSTAPPLTVQPVSVWKSSSKAMISPVCPTPESAFGAGTEVYLCQWGRRQWWPLQRSSSPRLRRTRCPRKPRRTGCWPLVAWREPQPFHWNVRCMVRCLAPAGKMPETFMAKSTPSNGLMVDGVPEGNWKSSPTTQERQSRVRQSQRQSQSNWENRCSNFHRRHPR